MTEKFNPEKVKNFNVRPLGDVSNFVVQELPLKLEGINSGEITAKNLSQHIADLIAGLSDPLICKTLAEPSPRDLAGLDLKMLETAIVHSGGKPPQELTVLVDIFAGKSSQPGGITYEEIILVNPPQDRRRFTRGEVGETERAFYEGHRLIEGHLDRAVIVLKNSIFALIANGKDAIAKVSEALNRIREDLIVVIDKTHTIGTQNPEHFGYFRKYLGGNPIRGTKGPSGAFTAGIPTIELFFAGEKLPQDYIDYLNNNMMYFPRKGRMDLKIAMSFTEEGLTITALSDKLGNPEPLKQAIEELSHLIRAFRGVHYKTVKAQIPQAISGQIVGTGGEKNPGTFLRERMKIRHT